MNFKFFNFNIKPLSFWSYLIDFFRKKLLISVCFVSDACSQYKSKVYAWKKICAFKQAFMALTFYDTACLNLNVRN